jgi:hypothetical protein
MGCISQICSEDLCPQDSHPLATIATNSSRAAAAAAEEEDEEIEEGKKNHQAIHTLPPASLTANTKPPRFPLTLSHFSYSVAKLTPSCSKLNSRFHSSTSCRRGGNSSRISSATLRVISLADSFVLSWKPASVSGVSGGGWNGECLRCGAGAYDDDDAADVDMDIMLLLLLP